MVALAIEPQINKAALYKKMAGVMGRLSRIPKSGVNRDQHYPYATESDIADAVRLAMAAENLALFVEMVEIEREIVTTAKGGKGILAKGVFNFTLACGETGATQTIRWEAEATDYSDKAVSKCVTFAEKTFLLKTFVISTGEKTDDPDEVTEEIESRQPTPKAIRKPANVVPMPTQEPPAEVQPTTSSEPAPATHAAQIVQLVKSELLDKGGTRYDFKTVTGKTVASYGTDAFKARGWNTTDWDKMVMPFNPPIDVRVKEVKKGDKVYYNVCEVITAPVATTQPALLGTDHKPSQYEKEVEF